MQAAASFFPLEKCWDSDNLHSCGEDSTLCSGVLDPQSSLWTRYWGGVLGQAAPPLGSGTLLLQSLLWPSIIFWLKGVRSSSLWPPALGRWQT